MTEKIGVVTFLKKFSVGGNALIKDKTFDRVIRLLTSR